MQPEHITVGDLFSRGCTYTVPLFQRPYVWDVKRWEPLWEDVCRVADEAVRGAPKVRPHFLGSVVVQQRMVGITQGQRREVIDGQQRLTTLQLLIRAAADALEAAGAPPDATRPLRRLLRNEDAPSSDPPAEFKVWPTNADRDRFAAVMKGTAKPSKEDRFVGGYEFLRGQVAAWLAEGGPDPEALAQRGHILSSVLRNQLWLIALNLTADDQAQVIFETLNARGTPLSPADLIKNLLLRRAEDEKADPAQLYETHWKEFDADEAYWRAHVGRGHTARPRVDFFLVHCLTMKSGTPISPGQLYEAFADWLRDQEGGRTADQMREIAALAKVYRDLDAASDASPDRVARAAARIKAMDFTSAWPLLLFLQADPARDPLDRAQAASWIESFLVRRLVCRRSTRGYSNLFSELMAEVVRAAPGPVAPVVGAFLARGTKELSIWPGDEEFGQAWRTMPAYHSLRRDRLTMILRALELALRGPLHDPTPIPTSLHVEHIMPQNWRAHWPTGASPDERDAAVQRIGNLTLLTASLNQSLSDSAWATKRTELRRYGLFALNAAVAHEAEWDETSIADRSADLLKVACQVWAKPPAPQPIAQAVSSP